MNIFQSFGFSKFLINLVEFIQYCLVIGLFSGMFSLVLVAIWK